MTECIERRTAISKLTALEVIEPSATMTDAKRVLADMPAADECKWFDGDWLGKRSQWREKCPRFHEPIKRTEMKRFTAEKIARQKRALFQVIKGADK